MSTEEHIANCRCSGTARHIACLMLEALRRWSR